MGAIIILKQAEFCFSQSAFIHLLLLSRMEIKALLIIISLWETVRARETLAVFPL